MKFVHSVERDIISGVSFLYIPEEYVVDQSSYYKEYFENHYDFIIGHGMIDKIWYAKDAKRKGMSSAPVFDVEELCSVANYCYFGHIHEHKAYGKNKRFKYVGPLTVWEYDKKDCGFYMFRYDKDTQIAKETYVENDMAQILMTFPIVVTDDMSIEELIHKVQLALDSDYDGLKIIIRIKSSSPIYIKAKNYLITKIGLYEKAHLNFIVDDDNVIETEEEPILFAGAEKYQILEQLFMHTVVGYQPVL